ncbi:MAG TPA: COX15/CtaA family protein [Roseiflexaceae bacterium]|nr:COX15/CtaA family protein [Roseiflexaceae bacterium]
MKLNRFALFAWAVLGYNLLVILWGAYVRATGSGAGCGDHWPLCNGEVIPRSPGAEMLVEFTHRASSGIALLLVVGLLVWAMRAYPKGHSVRQGAKLSMALIVVEALVGAGLVLFKLVAGDDSLYRVVAIAVHLVNTFLLLAALALTAWWASGGAPLRLAGRGGLAGALGAGMLGVIVVGAAGAITALGDTLFPARSLAEGIQQDFAATAHYLVQMRVIHPILAVGVGLYVVGLAWTIARSRPGRSAELLAVALTGLFLLQLAIGALNVVLLAPVWMQLVHLLMADLVWIALVLLGAAVLAQPVAPTGPALIQPQRAQEPQRV